MLLRDIKPNFGKIYLIKLIGNLKYIIILVINTLSQFLQIVFLTNSK